MITRARIKEWLSGDGSGREEHGFTLVELVLTLALIVLFLGAAVGIVSQGFSFLNAHMNRSTLNRVGNSTIDRLETLIVGCYEIVDADTNSTNFVYYADIDADDTGELVKIYASGTELIVEVDGVPSVVLSDLNGSVPNPVEFTYYSDLAHEPGYAITADYNEFTKVVKIALSLAEGHDNHIMTKLYERNILLKMGPEDRLVAE